MVITMIMKQHLIVIAFIYCKNNRKLLKTQLIFSNLNNNTWTVEHSFFVVFSLYVCITYEEILITTYSRTICVEFPI